MLKKRIMFTEPMLLLAEDEPAGKAFQVLKVGSFQHPRYGKVEITSRDLASLKESFDSRVRKIDLAINYEHGQSVAHGTKAAGWIRSLELREGGKELWAVPEWTEQGRKEVEGKEWKYSSAEIDLDWKDPESGVLHKRVLRGAALTNQPFIKGMASIAANENTNTEDQPMNLSEMKAALLADHGINLSELQAQTVELSDKVKALTTENATLAQKVELSEKAARDVKKAALIKRGMEEGKLTKAFAEGRFSEICDKQGLEFAEGMLADLPKVVPVGDSKGETPKGDTQKFSDAGHEVLAKALELQKTDKVEFSEAVDRVLKGDADLAKRYADLGAE